MAISGVLLTNMAPSQISNSFLNGSGQKEASLYNIFKNPDIKYRPFVRWWWNGDKIQKEELARELRLLKAAGIGGVEINPIAFPGNGADDLGLPSVEWLSDEWIELLQFTLNEARSLNMTCDLIAGTGFPSGAEFLKDEERSQKQGAGDIGAGRHSHIGSALSRRRTRKVMRMAVMTRNIQAPAVASERWNWVKPSV